MNVQSPPPKATEAQPAADQVHSILADSIQQIAQGWIDQLEAVKADADALQTQVLASVADTKAKLAAFHELGAKVVAHATESRKAIAALADGVAEIAGTP